MELGHPRQQRQGGFKALLLLAVLSIHAAAVWAAVPVFAFDIPAGDAQKTLQQFYSQSKIEMLYLADSVRGTRTNAVSGQIDAAAALDQMLRGTPLEFSFEDDFSFVSIRPRQMIAGPVEMRTASMRSVSGDVQALSDNALYGEPQIDQVVITGTLLHGVLNITSPLEFVTKREMKRSAYATVQDALDMLPSNMGGGPSEDFATGGNFARGSAVNLRGLGAGATLVLVNGHRQPYSGTEADFVDLSNIAWSAVERIEVLPDGASALYGSDAIAGVVNVIMRKDVEGAETQVRFGSAPGGGQEKLLAQLFGTRWDSGNALLSYQYTERNGLDASARAYAASADKRALGGTDHRSVRSNPANILDPATFLPAYAIPSGQDGRTLASTDLLASTPNLQNQYAGVELLPDRSMHSVFVSATQQLSSRVELFSEVRFNERRTSQDYIAYDQILTVPATNPFFVSPFAGAKSALVSYSFLDDFGPLGLGAKTTTLSGTFGAEASLSDTWKLKFSGSYGRESMHYMLSNQPNSAALQAALADKNPATAFNPFGDGSETNPATIEAVRSTTFGYSQSKVDAVGLTADGELFSLPSGAVKLAIGAERRGEQLTRRVTTGASFDRDIQSTYAELAVPLIGEPGDEQALPRLELSLAGRYERYSDFGSSSNPKVGLRWIPSDAVKLRTSWGTSFKAPKLINLYDRTSDLAGLIPLRDPRAGAGSSLVLFSQGSNPDLEQETASTWTAGIDLAPRALGGAQLSLTYYAIDYDNRILVPGPPSPFDILLQENQWSSVINRNPTQEEINAVCTGNPLSGTTVKQCESAAVAAIVDLRIRNMASTRVRGLDMRLDHSIASRFGTFDLGLNGGYVFSFRQATSSSSPLLDVVNTVGNPLAFRMRGTIEWNERGWNLPGWGASATLDRFGGYDNSASDLVSRVAPLTTLDVRVSYRVPFGVGFLEGVEMALNAANVFNVSPPFVDAAVGYDAANAQPYGRVTSFSVQKSW
jgi:outer membrane receptor protein involved in Fe transport